MAMALGTGSVGQLWRPFRHSPFERKGLARTILSWQNLAHKPSVSLPGLLPDHRFVPFVSVHNSVSVLMRLAETFCSFLLSSTWKYPLGSLAAARFRRTALWDAEDMWVVWGVSNARQREWA